MRTFGNKTREDDKTAVAVSAKRDNQDDSESRENERV
jgi:hypothetical protein